MNIDRTLAWFFLSLAMIGLIGAKAYHFLIRPDWTEPIAFRELWYVWLGSVLLAVIGGRLLKKHA